MKATIPPALAAMLLVAPMRAVAQPGPETLDAWRHYVAIDTEHDMAFRRRTPSLATARSVATSIRETGGGDRGFLWRLNSYWRYEAVNGGVAVEIESLTLSRGIPSVFRPVVAPIVRSIARESMCRTLDNVRKTMTAG